MEKIDLRLGDSAEIFHVSCVESDGGELRVDGGTIHHDGKGGGGLEGRSIQITTLQQL